VPPFESADHGNSSPFFHFQLATDMKEVQEDPSLWSMIFAGGDGQRMRPLIRRWLGSHKPTASGTRNRSGCGYQATGCLLERLGPS
jgi:hypothetical protein